MKKYKESLNNITHQLLHIRHQFKIGFFSELKMDIASAVKAYKNAYAYLTDSARIHDTNILEMKMIAGFLTYKVTVFIEKICNENQSESFRSAGCISIRVNPSKQSIIFVIMRTFSRTKSVQPI